MDLIVDTNILFSALTHSKKIQQLLIELYREGHTLHAPTALITELYRHHKKIAKYSPLPENLLREIIREILPRILQLHTTTPIPPEIRDRAKRLAAVVDPSDWPFVALSMYLDVPLWTGDKELIGLAVRTGFREFTAVDTHAVGMLLEGKSWEEIQRYLREKYKETDNDNKTNPQ